MEEERLISFNQGEVGLLKDLIDNELNEKQYGDHAFIKELEDLYERLDNKDSNHSNQFEIQTFDPETEETAQVFGQGVNAIKVGAGLEIWMEGLNYTALFDHYDGRRRLLVYRKDWEEPVAFYEGEDKEPKEEDNE